jgi:transposase
MGDRTTYVGLDVRKDGVVVAVAEGGIRGEVRDYGRIANTAAASDRLVRKLDYQEVQLRFCYEAAPCGYGIHPTPIVGTRARMRRSGAIADPETGSRRIGGMRPVWRGCKGELTAVWIPDAGHEAMRDLVRARLDAVHALRRARQQLSGFLSRQGCHYGRPAWTKLHRRWLAGLQFEQAMHHIVLEDYVQAVEVAEARRDRLTAQIEATMPDRALAPVVAALQTMRGMAGQCGNADRRTGRPLALRQPTPADGLSRSGAVRVFQGASVRRGGLCYRFPARVSRELLLRQEEQPKPIREIAWKAQLRLCARYRKLARTGKPANVVTAAIARELTGFIWAIARRVPPAMG